MNVIVTRFYQAAIGATLVLGVGASCLAQSAPDSFAELVEEISPAVVNITISATIEQNANQMIPDDMPLPEMFRDFLENNPNLQGQPRIANALGSGFIVDKEGYIVTNNHVVEQADVITIESYDGQSWQAELIGRDPKTDIALLKVDADVDLPVVEFGDSDDMRVGDWVVAVGNPLGQGFSVSAGIVSARGRKLDGSYDDFIQTDAAINRGNSGGPLFNTEGEVIGVNTAILSPDGGSIGIGFAMSSRVVEKVVDQLQEYGETRRGWLGVVIQDVNADMAEALGMPDAYGALVSNVPPGPAETAGIKAGDVILALNGERIDDISELINLVGNSDVGSVAILTVQRNDEDEPIDIEVKLGRLEDAELARSGGSREAPTERIIFGMSIVPLNAELATQFQLEIDSGLLIKKVDNSSVAANAGLMPGDVIREINQTPVGTFEGFEAQIDAAREMGRGAVLLLVQRENSALFLPLPLE